eukprot:TRINITY_DN28223_c0_g1_i2.p3 TRINITY_DN28223_c0_g1~~TRINITY_DN28223_c0_g1_i2.p3  ORF type:complete len:106 (-),score=3.89 TRINITY_DN28223_c0_g1_i2:60-356(-)
MEVLRFGGGNGTCAPCWKIRGLYSLGTIFPSTVLFLQRSTFACSPWCCFAQSALQIFLLGVDHLVKPLKAFTNRWAIGGFTKFTNAYPLEVRAVAMGT